MVQVAQPPSVSSAATAPVPIAPVPKKLHYNAFGPYKLGKTIGQGEFGKVKLGYHLQSGNEVAIKLIKKESISQPARRQKLIREIEILQSVNHRHIIKLWEVIETDSYIGMVLSYASGGELFEYVLSKRYLKEPEASRLFSQLIMGVGYLHQLGIVHRDLKLENLLLDKDRNLIIADFGFANRFNAAQNDLLSTSCGSPCYAAPELVINDSYVAEGADIWSCGVILYALICGYLPYDDDPTNQQGDNINALYKYILETKLQFPSNVSLEAQHLVLRILVTNPEKRATMQEIRAHKWLAPYRHLFPAVTLKPVVPKRESLSLDVKINRTSAILSPVQESPTPSSVPPSQPESIDDNSSLTSAVTAPTALNKSHITPLAAVRETAPKVRKSVDFSSSIPKKQEVVESRERAQSLDQPRIVAPSGNLDAEFSKLVQKTTPNGAAEAVFDAGRLKFHSGPIDQKALTNINPLQLMANIERLLKDMGLQVMATPHDAFKLKVVQSKDDRALKKEKKNLSTALAAFPVALLQKVKLMTQFGLSYNRGYNGTLNKPPPTPSVAAAEEPIKMYVMVHRIRNLDGLYTVDLKRVRGDIWAFRHMYNQIIDRLELKMSQ